MDATYTAPATPPHQLVHSPSHPSPAHPTRIYLRARPSLCKRTPAAPQPPTNETRKNKRTTPLPRTSACCDVAVASVICGREVGDGWTTAVSRRVCACSGARVHARPFVVGGRWNGRARVEGVLWCGDGDGKDSVGGGLLEMVARKCVCRQR